MTNLHLEPLGGGLQIYVSDSYHFSTDTILLAHFSLPSGKRDAPTSAPAAEPFRCCGSEKIQILISPLSKFKTKPASWLAEPLNLTA